MRLLDEEEIQRNRLKNQKKKKSLIIIIILLSILSALIIAFIVYREYNPNKITTYINGQEVKNFDSILDLEPDENGKTQIYVPIKDVAEYFGYKSYNGDYTKKSEEQDKCYVIKEDSEVAMYTAKSNKMYKLNLQNKNNNYEDWELDKKVFEANGKLYTTIDGIEKGYNVSFNYNEKKKRITIYTMDYLVQSYAKPFETTPLKGYEKTEIDIENCNNNKAIFNNMLIVNADGKYGVINVSDNSFILEPKYDNIEYVQYSSDFLVQSGKKKGIISKESKTKVNAVYDELTLIDRKNNLYRIKKDNLYGVINDKDKVIIHPENSKIGIDINEFSYSGVKNGYILLDSLIPVEQDGKWAFYDTKGKLLTDGFVFDKIGCSVGNSNNVYSLLEIPEYNVVVVGNDNGQYTFMNTKGKYDILPFVFEQIYMKISSGEISYYMKYNNKTYDVPKYLIQRGVKKIEAEN